MTLLDSLLDAIIRLEGDALVMHVGERPYVLTTSSSASSFRGPLSWGQVELSSRALTAEAIMTMVGQMLPPAQLQVLDEMGAVEHEIGAPGESAQRFMVVAARGGDDVWVEVKKKPEPVPVAVEPDFVPVAAEPEPVAVAEAAPIAEAVTDEPVPAEAAPEAEWTEMPDMAPALAEGAVAQPEPVSLVEEAVVPPAEVEAVAAVGQVEESRAADETLTPAVMDAGAVEGTRGLEVVLELDEAAEEPADWFTLDLGPEKPADVPAVTAEAQGEPLRAETTGAAEASVEEAADAVAAQDAASAAAVQEAASALVAEEAAAAALAVNVANAVAAQEAINAANEAQAELDARRAALAEAEARAAEAAAALAAREALLAEREAVLMAEVDARIAARETTLAAEAGAARAAEEEAAAARAARQETSEAEAVLEARRVALAEAEAKAGEAAAILAAREQALAEREATLVAEAEARLAAREEALAAEAAAALAAQQRALASEAAAALAEREHALAAEAAAALAAKEAALAAREEVLAAQAAAALAEQQHALGSEAAAALAAQQEALASEAAAALAAREQALASEAAVALAAREQALASEAAAALAAKEAEAAVALAAREQALASEAATALAAREEALAAEAAVALAAKEAQAVREMAAREEALAAEAARALAAKQEALETEAAVALAAQQEALAAQAAVFLAAQQQALASEATELSEAAGVHVQNQDALPSEAVEGQAAMDGAHQEAVKDVRAVMRLHPKDHPSLHASSEGVVPVLRDALERGASTVYAIAGARPMLRIEGEIAAAVNAPLLASADIDRFAFEFAPRDEVAAAPTEWMCSVPGVGRVRCVSFEDEFGRGLVFHLAANITSADQLGLSREVQALCREADGLVVVAGPRGSGKSSLLGAFVDLINRTRADHIITIESRVRTLHERRHALISQREVDGDGDAVARAVRAALREGPDVLVVDDVRSPEAIAVAIDAARAGRLVFASIPAPNSTVAIQRLIDAFAVDRRPQIRALLAGALRAVISQVLVQAIAGGRVGAREVLLSSQTVEKLILDGATAQVPIAIESGRRLGMRTQTDALVALVRDGVITAGEASRHAPDRGTLLAALQHEGIDVTELERRA